MYRAFIALVALFVIAASQPEERHSFDGPGKFCAYAAIIEMQESERIVPLQAGIHSANFSWEGGFGKMKVRAVGWASEPKGRKIAIKTGKGHIRFAQRKVDEGYSVAIWNGKNGAVYFISPRRITAAQYAAIDRVDVFDEAEPDPENCKYRMLFAWE